MILATLFCSDGPEFKPARQWLGNRLGAGIDCRRAVAGFLQEVLHRRRPDKAIVKSGMGGLDVTTAGGKFIIPLFHRYEFMDLTLKSFEIHREQSEGLICQDNIRADIKVAFFIRVDNTQEEMKEVAQSIGARRCSEIDTLRELFDAKFSEALKTVGKQFDFVDLYDQRDKFKDEILKVVGTDLNGYRLDDAAIDSWNRLPSKCQPNQYS